MGTAHQSLAPVVAADRRTASLMLLVALEPSIPPVPSAALVPAPARPKAVMRPVTPHRVRVPRLAIKSLQASPTRSPEKDSLGGSLLGVPAASLEARKPESPLQEGPEAPSRSLWATRDRSGSAVQHAKSNAKRVSPPSEPVHERRFHPESVFHFYSRAAPRAARHRYRWTGWGGQEHPCGPSRPAVRFFEFGDRSHVSCARP